jgi:hypothetical protein
MESAMVEVPAGIAIWPCAKNGVVLSRPVLSMAPACTVTEPGTTPERLSK